MSGDELHSFIVRIWLEERAAECACSVWRGSVTHVISGQRVHFCDIESLPSLIRPYLKAHSVELQLPEGE